MSEAKKINVLLLGETGTGKSTFINAFHNYLNGSLDEAQSSELKWLIPTCFSVTDENFNLIEINLSKNGDSNENKVSGEAGTRFPKSYHLNFKNQALMHIIDTPGIGDPEGFKKDQENFNNIINHISSMDYLNGVCILLKPNVSRLSLQFRYCFKELMVHLHKSALPNILFCFTNTRGTFFQPGETINVLRTLLNQIEQDSGIKIPLKKENVFCFENESFRYLAASKQGAEYTEKEKEEFLSSWDISSKSAHNMVEYISKLKFHDLSKTLNLNKARDVLSELARPLAEISQNIQINIKLANDKFQELSLHTSIINDFDKLYITQVDLEPLQLGFPRTVCTHANCVQNVNIGKTFKTDYVTHCHSHCYLTDVEQEIINNPKLRDCACMRNDRTNCNICTHDWTYHMHITYENIQSEKKVLSDELKNAINRNDNKAALNTAVKDAFELIEQLKKEQKEIIEIATKFARFTNENSILPFNADLNEYLDLLIREEEGKKAQGIDNDQVLKGLKETKENFETQKLIFDFEKQSELEVIDIYSFGEEDIDDLLNDLFRLPLTGQKIKKSVEVLKKYKK